MFCYGHRVALVSLHFKPLSFDSIGISDKNTNKKRYRFKVTRRPAMDIKWKKWLEKRYLEYNCLPIFFTFYFRLHNNSQVFMR